MLKHSLLCSKFDVKHQDDDVGATMVEFALFLPILLILVGFSLFFGHAYFAYASLNSAIGGVRPGYTRGNLIDINIIQPIADFKGLTSGSEPPDRLKPLLASSDQMNYAFDVTSGTYAVHLHAKMNNANFHLQDLHESSLYSLVYAINVMRQNLGEDIKVPCDQPGCLLCIPLGNPINSTTLPNDPFTAIECKYYPPIPLYSMLNAGFVTLGLPPISAFTAMTDPSGNVVFTKTSAIGDYGLN